MKQRIKVIDFYIEEFDLRKKENFIEDAFCCSIAIYFTLSQTNPDELEIDDLDYFNLIVGNPNGLKIYFENFIGNSTEPVIFFPHLAIIRKYNKQELLQAIKNKIEQLFGKSQSEVIAKALIYFDWQYQDDESEFNKMF